jgi:predicted kinase
MMMEFNCYILIGLPCSGKSTWIRSNNKDYNPVYSSDAVIESIAEEYNVTYNEAWSYLAKFADKVFWVDLKHVKENPCDDIFIDRTHLTFQSRKRVMDALGDKYNFHAIVFDVSEEVRNERMNNRVGKEIPDNVIESMKKSYVEPHINEGFSTIMKGL